jgi:hypothetical protein
MNASFLLKYELQYELRIRGVSSDADGTIVSEIMDMRYVNLFTHHPLPNLA